jgi:hypothetical protein
MVNPGAVAIVRFPHIVSRSSLYALCGTACNTPFFFEVSTGMCELLTLVLIGCAFEGCWLQCGVRGFIKYKATNASLSSL